MIVTIDGPAGAGKSTVAKRLAAELGFQYLDTGAMYRALVVAAKEADVDLNDESALVECCEKTKLEIAPGTVAIDGRNVTEKIRQPEVANNIHHVADNVAIRNLLVERQREIARTGNFVCEGRDQGTVAFPDADCKIFLTASSTERARRRQSELADKGVDLELSEVEQDQDERDRRDYNRPVGKLAKADDAIEFVTDGKSIDQVVQELKQLVSDTTPK